MIQHGNDKRTLVYLMHVGNGKPGAKYSTWTFDAIRDACGPSPMIVVRTDDATELQMPVEDARQLCKGIDVSRVIIGGWSAGVRGIRRLLLASEQGARIPSWCDARIEGIVACDGLHAPWAVRDREGKLPLGPSEVFRRYVGLAMSSRFAFVLTHSMQDYMENATSNPRYLATPTVARELSGYACSTEVFSYPELDPICQNDGYLQVRSYASKSIDYDAHVHQQRVALPEALKQMRDWGLMESC